MKKLKYLKCKCGSIDFSNRVHFGFNHKKESVFVQQHDGSNVSCDKCNKEYNYFKLISYPYKRKKEV
jgi:hypothetical protein|tara:strand:+ start:3269 stop:3469 length:201 start_codon:yes stop_codon:yes gene_type:complete